MTILNPWQWYCCARTFSNSLEMTLTVVALNFWPWELLGDLAETQGGFSARRDRLTRFVEAKTSSKNPPS